MTFNRERSTDNVREQARAAHRFQGRPHSGSPPKDGPFEHEAHLKELLARQAQLNAALDLGKNDAQAAEPAVEPVMETAVPATSGNRSAAVSCC